MARTKPTPHKINLFNTVPIHPVSPQSRKKKLLAKFYSKRSKIVFTPTNPTEELKLLRPDWSSSLPLQSSPVKPEVEPDTPPTVLFDFTSEQLWPRFSIITIPAVVFAEKKTTN